MSYATKDDLIAYVRDAKELVRLTDVGDEATGQINDALVNAALGRADNLINSYIGGLKLDLTTVPQRLADVACAITRYFLWSDRASERVRQDYADGVAWLKDVQAGRAAIGDGNGATQVPSAGSPKFISRPPALSGRLKGF